MSDYKKLTEALREAGDTNPCVCANCGYWNMCEDEDCIITQAAAAIEALEADVEKWTYNATLEQSKAIANFESYCKLKEKMPKRGEWVHEELDNFRKYKVTCPHCGAWFIGNYDAYDEPSDFNYCPHCGNICNPVNLDWENELKERERIEMAKMEVQDGQA